MAENKSLVPSSTHNTIGTSGNKWENIYAKAVNLNGTDLQTTLNGKAGGTHTHDDRYYTESEVNSLLGGKASSSHSHSWDSITSKPSSFTPASHTHTYAGSSSAGGAATSANKLNTNAGDSTTPVYFANGVPVACSGRSTGATVIESSYGTNTWYRKWSDGWIECGGHYTTSRPTDNIYTFAKAFTSIPTLTLGVACNYGGNVSESWTTYNTLSTTNFTVASGYGYDNRLSLEFNYYACGK